MLTAARLGLFGVGLVAVFGVAATAANTFVPAETVTAWTQAAEDTTMQDHPSSTAAHTVGGLSVEQSGYVLDEIAAPGETTTSGVLSFRILDPAGKPLSSYGVDHDKELHLIVVRTDGAFFDHVHPTRDAAGVWSIPWTWKAGGSYRIYADFQATDAAAPIDLTLSRTVQVAGDFAPVRVASTSTVEVDGFKVSVTGQLYAGESSDLVLAVRRDGSPVTELEPYLGAFGHLVALRAGDLAYLHVHPERDSPKQGDTAGPDVAFVATAPTGGRYLLFFDFQVNGQVHTAALTLDAAPGVAGGSAEHGNDH
ncbi:MAG: heavy-metal-associated domain-containing protein [Microbacterium sp.]|uniref:heavy-metal-associated domain-containing protein n=1 Tax=Microbacterium sp. TaxID=51671 RepID=UPI002719289E|nr:heavy-metal-associated domain-containing protein [Microbacterium sp.]MDO8383944.1 heavy-metal-associated domain-containing protein [Microbacterium sp.]